MTVAEREYIETMEAIAAGMKAGEEGRCRPIEEYIAERKVLDQLCYVTEAGPDGSIRPSEDICQHYGIKPGDKVAVGATRRGIMLVGPREGPWEDEGP